ncbi:MAG: biosynthetic arginine decarboxylase [Halobacteriovoraceae bacterium]|nr:biosynthetic arginine decarboxylase [Halobacteriovoraceae bacterium]
MTWISDNSKKAYRIENWGEKFFSISHDGELQVNPFQDERAINFVNIINEIHAHGIELPAVVRFHDILRKRVNGLNQIFREQMKKNQYKGKYQGVFPIKVNQMREVVEEIIWAGDKYDFGLEAGSKTELLSLLNFDLPDKSVCILNGYKDEEYIKLSFLGRMMKKNMILVVEKYSEIEKIIEISKEFNVAPIIGVRVKVESRGSGIWSESAGKNGKFGLTLPEVLQVKDLLRKENLLDCFKLLHFHIGSQISSLKNIRNALIEVSRVYSNLIKEDVPLEYIDIGGGLGVNYLGHNDEESNFAINYDSEEYVKTIIGTLKDICDQEAVPHPNVVSESGRYLTAHHSCILTNVIGTADAQYEINSSILEEKNEHECLSELRKIFRELDVPHKEEYLKETDGLLKKALEAFIDGKMSLRDKAKLEIVYENLLKKINESDAEKKYAKYICNFSVFQSIPDSWGIGQILPICPVKHLDKEPTVKARLVDITCDSDGIIKKYIGEKCTEDHILLHDITDKKDYPLGIFMTGAYQDIMGDMHNLFGRLNEVHIFYDEEDEEKFYIEEIINGNTTGTILSTLQYNVEQMAGNVKSQIDKLIQSGEIRPRDGIKLIDYYEKCLGSYSYLDE